MDYLSVTQSAFFSASIITLIFLGLFVKQSIKHSWKRLLIIGILFQFISLVTIGSTYSGISLDTRSLLVLELGRYLSWFIALTLLLNRYSSSQEWPVRTKTIALAIIGISLFALVEIFNPSIGSTSQISLSYTAIAVLMLIYSEQVTRNVSSLKMIKLFGICLFLLFSFDAMLYGQIYILESSSPGLWQAKAGVSFLFSFTLAIGSILFSDETKSTSLTLTRPVAFYSTTAIVALMIISVIASAAAFLENFNGFIGSYLSLMALLWSLFAISALIFSSTFRQRVEVFVNKYFFSLKYDYRVEWLSASSRLSNLDSNDDNYYRDILELFLNALKANDGCLWITKNDKLIPVSNSDPALVKPSVPIASDFIKIMLNKHWIYVPQTRSKSLSKYNELLPSWTRLNSDIWIIAPLISNAKLVGMVLINNPIADKKVTYEDRDLMTNISTQVANHIMLHQQEAIISENKQLETYHRLSAFIMHDINNVIAQLDLIGRNAEKHKNNPEFIDDMISTVHNSVIRMQKLIQKFNPASVETPYWLTVSHLLESVVFECSDRIPKPTLEVIQDFDVQADATKLSLALKNLIRNAQDATSEETGWIHIQIGTKTDKPLSSKILIIEDNGSGMAASFIESELFKPFSSTKEKMSIGIGAYLTKSYFDHIGARLEVKSKPGEGTSFEVIFS